MRKHACHGQVRYWALLISLGVHAAALAVFTGVQLSSRAHEEPSAKTAVSMHMIEKVIETPSPVPAPKVETIEKPKPAPEPEDISPPRVVEEKPPVQPEPLPAAVVDSIRHEPVKVVHEVEFFGQKSIVQRICYVVDCSGSMYGQMYRVKEQLKKSIGDLNPNQAFCILFFMEGREVLMSGAGCLEKATVGTKSQAYGLINDIKPGGSTDAAHALECAMRLRDRNGYAPEVIYFLTDGFNLDESGLQLFVQKVNGLRNSLAPSAVLHTIGFWPQERDRWMLTKLAADSGGVYIEAKL